MNGDYRLGDWTIRPLLDRVERGDEIVHIKPKAMAVLDCLAQAGGEVVTRDALFDAVWPNLIVSDATLTQCVAELRHALGDAAQSPRYIETIPKVGFRLVAPVKAFEPDALDESADPKSEAAHGRRRPSRRLVALWAALFTIALVAIAEHLRDPPHGPSPRVETDKSIAVLPFVDASPGGDQAWISEGLAAELIARLAQIPELKVIGQTSSFRFRESTETPREIAATLGVRYLLEGSVQWTGERLRITTKLIDAASGFNVWSEVFDGAYADIITVQDEISESVLNALSISLGVGEFARVEGGTTVVEAFEAYQRAWKLFAVSAESHLEGIRLLKRATELDPDFALAWVALATFYHFAPLAVDGLLPVDWMERADEAIRIAQELAPASPIVLAASIDVHVARREWAEVDRLMVAAPPESLELHPTVLFSRGVALMKTGHSREALAVLERARTLEPLRDDIATQLAHAYLATGQVEKSLAECERGWKLPAPRHWVRASVCIESALAKDDSDTIDLWIGRYLQQASERRGGLVTRLAEKLDDPSAMRSILHNAFERGAAITDADYVIAIWAAHLGDTRLAIDALQRTPDAYGLWTPLMADVRRQPDFLQVVEQLGLVDYWQASGWPDHCRGSDADGLQCE